MDVDPVDLVVIHHFVEFRFREIRNGALDLLDRLRFAERIIILEAEDHFAFTDEARAQRIRDVAGKALVDQAHRTLKVTPVFAAENILRQANVQKLKIVVDVHRAVPPVQFAFIVH